MNSAIRHIVEQLDIMSFLNMISCSVLSGCGTSVAPSLNDLDTIEELCRDMPPNQKPYNVFFMNSLYKRGMPVYAKEIDNPYNFESYQWLDKKRNEAIDIETMAYSIINCCSLVERLITSQIQLENNGFVAFVLFKVALHQARMIKRYLRVGDLYYSGEDLSDDSKELHIQIAPRNPDILSQILVQQAFTALKRIGDFNIPYMYLKNNEFDEDFELLHPLYANIIENIAEIRSRDLVHIGLCVTEIYIKSGIHCETCYNTITSIADELQSRLNSDGEISRTSSDSEGSSTTTLFNGLNFLSKLNYMFGRKEYNKVSEKLYSKIKAMWSKEHKIFKLKDTNKQSYSIKDITSMISALLSYYCSICDAELAKELEEQIEGIYETAFIKSQIFVNQSQPILQQCIISSEPVAEEVEAAVPVFCKTFEYKLSKDKFYCEADVFRADYVLPACCMLLNNISNYCI